jgi:hypothetical protein
MNERIKQLAEQALEETHRVMGSACLLQCLLQEAFDDFYTEKFAELIVRECVELVSVNRDLAIEDGWNVDEAMSTAINDIEEHFGVEE